MGTQRNAACSWIVAMAILGLALGAPVPAATAQAGDSRDAAEAADPDGGWPRGYETPDGAEIIMYQPQIASWDGQKHLVAWAAVSYLEKGAKDPAMGTVKIEAETEVALDERLVSFVMFKITEVNFPSLQKEQTAAIITELTKAIPDEDRVIALDRVLAAIDKSQIIPKNADGIKADPPVVFFSTRPALLVVFDGEPIWSPIKENSLKFAVNTNWDLFQDGASGTFLLRNGDYWLKSADLKGPWAPAGSLPDSFSRLPDADWQDVKESLPGKTISSTKVPDVLVTYEPAEMLLLDGAPQYKKVDGTGLFWVGNTESDLFRMGKNGAFYFLVAGRWFSAPDVNGPWAFATPNLPEDFKHISPEHPRARVLASVPGTPQAMEAVLLAQVPQTARVNLKQVQAPEVVYQDAPRFEPIEKTSLQRAVNTDKDIIKVGDLYYMCFQGVWFMAASPNGPWQATKSVPGEIYTIPPSSPVYNVTYVTVVEDDDDDWAEFVCAAGYTGMMVAWGCAVWGTGYHYPPYVWHGAFCPVYYPRPVTYGCAAWYNPWTGRYGWAAGAYGPYGGVGAGAVYNPRTGTYARGGVAYGPYGAAGRAVAYNPRTGGFGATRQGSNVYGSWGATYVQRGDNWAYTKRYTNKATGSTTRITRTDDGAVLTHRGDNGFVAAGSGGNVYAGKDGNVYRKQGDNWQKYDGGGWTNTGRAGDNLKGTAKPRTNQPQSKDAINRKPQTGAATQRPAQTAPAARPVERPTVDQLNRDSRARNEGAQRTKDYNNYRNSGGGLQGGGKGGGLQGLGKSGDRSGGLQGGGLQGGGRGGGLQGGGRRR